MKFNQLTIIGLSLIIFALCLSGCVNGHEISTPTLAQNPITGKQEAGYSSETIVPVKFTVSIPESLNPSDTLFLVIVDDVTGISFNDQLIKMDKENDTTYSIQISVPQYSVLKYRYEKRGESAVSEYNSLNEPVRYRLYYADAPSKVVNIVSRWSVSASAAETGRARGKITETNTGLPLPDLLIEIGGNQAITAADGSFLIKGLAPGKHVTTCYSMSGEYLPFKQEVIIDPSAETPIEINVAASEWIDVRMTVIVPEGSPANGTLRLVGNIQSLGMNYGNLYNQNSILPENGKKLEKTDIQTYQVTLRLPKGIDIRYKYTFGDGLWNSEHELDGSYAIRQLILNIDATSFAITDNISTWFVGSNNCIKFNLESIPPLQQGEKIYIQFNLLGWSTPLPMWSGDNIHWQYELMEPTNIVGPLEYRYCRNAQCGTQIPIAANASFPALKINDLTQSIEVIDSIETWLWADQTDGQVTVLGGSIQPREADFIRGIAIDGQYHPSWSLVDWSSVDIAHKVQANTIVFTPTWSATRLVQPQLEPVFPGDILAGPLTDELKKAGESGLQVILKPGLFFGESSETWWEAAPKTDTWWNIWFEHYSRFLVHFATVAEESGVEVLVVNDSISFPLQPYIDQAGLQENGEPDYGEWNELIQKVREIYHGKIAWEIALEDDEIIKKSPAVDVDMILVKWELPLANEPDTPAQTMSIHAGDILDIDLYPMYVTNPGIPLVVTFSFPSVRGGSGDCISLHNLCIEKELLAPPAPDFPDIALDLAEQSEAYNAMLSAVNQRTWISGVIVNGSYPIVILEDKSTSFNGKPAEKVLWYWFNGFAGN